MLTFYSGTSSRAAEAFRPLELIEYPSAVAIARPSVPNSGSRGATWQRGPPPPMDSPTQILDLKPWKGLNF